MDTKTVVCFLPSDKNIFSIKSNERTTFEDLRVAIHQKNIHTLGHISAHRLNLYKINVGFSNLDQYCMIIRQISERTFEFDQKEELGPPLCHVSSIFKEHLNPGMIDILVEPPEVPPQGEHSTNGHGHW